MEVLRRENKHGDRMIDIDDTVKQIQSNVTSKTCKDKLIT